MPIILFSSCVLNRFCPVGKYGTTPNYLYCGSVTLMPYWSGLRLGDSSAGQLISIICNIY